MSPCLKGGSCKAKSVRPQGVGFSASERGVKIGDVATGTRVLESGVCGDECNLVGGGECWREVVKEGARPGVSVRLKKDAESFGVERTGHFNGA